MLKKSFKYVRQTGSIKHITIQYYIKASEIDTICF